MKLRIAAFVLSSSGTVDKGTVGSSRQYGDELVLIFRFYSIRYLESQLVLEYLEFFRSYDLSSTQQGKRQQLGDSRKRCVSMAMYPHFFWKIALQMFYAVYYFFFSFLQFYSPSRPKAEWKLRCHQTHMKQNTTTLFIIIETANIYVTFELFDSYICGIKRLSRDVFCKLVDVFYVGTIQPSCNMKIYLRA